MKPANSAMISYLNSLQGTDSQFFMANCFTFTLSDGTVVMMTDADCTITLTRPAFPGDPGSGPAVFYSGGGSVPLILLEGMKWSIGTEADTINITFMVPAGLAVGGAPLIGSFEDGSWDNALVQIERVYCPLPTDPTATGWVNSQPTAATFATLGSVPLFLGNIADVTQIDRMSVKFEAKDRRELFNVPTPFNYFQAACRWPLYGAGCTLNKATFGQSGTVISGVGTGTLQVNVSLLCPNGWFSQGTCQWSGGVNSGVLSAVRIYNGSGIVLAVSDSTGSGAVIGAVVNSSGVLTSLLVLNGGSGYTAPTLAISGGGGTGATGTLGVTGGVITSATLGSGGSGFANASLLFNLPLPNSPSAGDSFTAYPGCDHMQATCQQKFNNLTNFGGTPYTPVAETAV